MNPKSRSDTYGRRINRSHSTVVATIVPYLSVLIASLTPMFFIATALPIIPPLGFMMLLAWRLVRPGLLPVWAGFPLGLFDDLFSGQPLGSAILLWSVAMIAIELIETRFPWRSFAQDWFTAGLILLVYVPAAMLVSGGELTLVALGPQLMLSILVFPLFARLVARLDQMRLTRWRTVG
ncbi:rod shape-determining protein MreD [Erythrobacter sp. QSSC1-22B]|uniref:rod shape-determining protein MreD n=1 Tax=Erythrobacter sp. QSSC1-22B TaxID=1860125 RepID=UPI0008047FC0|nr:rod shape-determining protein MreD [Erythrobacter sp. QSSC1-22B]